MGGRGGGRGRGALGTTRKRLLWSETEKYEMNLFLSGDDVLRI